MIHAIGNERFFSTASSACSPFHARNNESAYILITFCCNVAEAKNQHKTLFWPSGIWTMFGFHRKRQKPE